MSEATLSAAGLSKCVQDEGEVVYLPDMWWHATFNEGDWALAVGGQGESPPAVPRRVEPKHDDKAATDSPFETAPECKALTASLFDLALRDR